MIPGPNCQVAGDINMYAGQLTITDLGTPHLACGFRTLLICSRNLNRAVKHPLKYYKNALVFSAHLRPGLGQARAVWHLFQAHNGHGAETNHRAPRPEYEMGKTI